MILLLPFLILFAAALIISSVALKGMALWRASKRGELKWFIALLIVNTIGILELLYLLKFSGRERKE